MTPAQTLVVEHGPILRAIALLESAADRLGAGERPPKDDWLDLVRFLRGYADKLHHQKEEALFLPAARAVAGGRYAAYVDEVMAEHVKGRETVAAIEAAVHSFYAGNDHQLSVATGAVHNYAVLLTGHIRKENRLFPEIESEFIPEVRTKLDEEFARLEKAEAGEGESAMFLSLLDRLGGK